jgi:uncharacterized Tic20 family protein
MNSAPTPEERIWAVLSHLSALAFGMGMMLPILGWSEQRGKSKYASFQSLQALGYQSLGYTVWLLSYLVLLIVFLILIMIESFLETKSGTTNGTLSVIGSGLFLLVFFGTLAIYLLLPAIAAIACGFGKNFHYPILGARLARYLEYGDETAELRDEHQERWVAAMGHFSVIILFWGLFVPLTTWILQRRQNTFLKFQAIQTTVYQLFVNALYVAAMILSFVATIPLMIWTVLDGSFDNNSVILIVGGIIFLLTMLVGFLVLLAIPLFHILGQWAGYRELKGDNYRYPLIGKLVEKYLTKSYGIQELAPEPSGEPLNIIKENS